MLREGRGGDGLKDSWFDRNAGWIKNTLTWVGRAVFVLAVIALVIALFVPGSTSPSPASPSPRGGAQHHGAALTVGMLVGQTAMWKTGHGSGSDVAWSLAGWPPSAPAWRWPRWLAPSAAPPPGSARGSPPAGRGVPRSRPGAARAPVRRRPARSRRQAGAQPLGPRQGRLRGRRRGCRRARTAVSGITGTPSTGASRAITWGDRAMAELVTLTGRLDDAVPGSVRLGAVHAVTQGTAGAWGLGVVGGQAVRSGVVTLDHWINGGDRQAAVDEARVRTVDRWSTPLLHAR
jgi:hypothetical protein